MFKVGDKVEVITDKWNGEYLGLTGTITRETTSFKGAWYVDVGGDSHIYYPKEIKLIEKKEEQMKTWGEMSDEEKGALLLAHHEGKVIERFVDGNMGGWVSSDKPLWYPDCTYRIKPEPKVETVTMYGRCPDEIGLFFGTGEKPWRSDTHKITFDVVDGEPDCTSIKMEKL